MINLGLVSDFELYETFNYIAVEDDIMRTKETSPLESLIIAQF